MPSLAGRPQECDEFFQIRLWKRFGLKCRHRLGPSSDFLRDFLCIRFAEVFAHSLALAVETVAAGATIAEEEDATVLCRVACAGQTRVRQPYPWEGMLLAEVDHVRPVVALRPQVPVGVRAAGDDDGDKRKRQAAHHDRAEDG